MSVIDLNQYRQEREAVEREVLVMDDSELELYAIDGDLEDEAESMELARQMVYSPLYCVKRENGIDRKHIN